MDINFELILFWGIVLTGIIWMTDAFFFAPKRQQKPGEELTLPLIVDYAKSFFPVLLVVFLLRSFVVEPFRIPSGSLKPTLLVGDFILVNKFNYGIRLPILHKKILPLSEPKKGDIVVFRFPPNPKVDYVKRIVGLPGDKISYINKVLYINGKPAPQEFQAYRAISDDNGGIHKVEEKLEKLNSIEHKIFVRSDRAARDFRDLVVPEGHYFAMGDNRDDSSDSRTWGFVPEENLIGNAFAIWMSWNKKSHNVRWSRIGSQIH